MKAREFFQRAMMQPPTISGQVQSVTLDAVTGRQTSATVMVGGQTVSIGLDALAPTLGQGDMIRLEQHGSAAAAEYRLVGVTSGAQVLSGFTQAMTAGATIAGATYGAGDVIVGSLTGGNLLIEYATGNIYHRIGNTVYGIEYADGSQVFGEHELVEAVWTPVGYNVLIEAAGISLRYETDKALFIDADEITIAMDHWGKFGFGSGDHYVRLEGTTSEPGVASGILSAIAEAVDYVAEATMTIAAKVTSELLAWGPSIELTADVAGSSADRIEFYAGTVFADFTEDGLSVDDAVRLTPEGGLAVKVVAGEALSRGNVVYVKQSGGADGKVWKTVYTDGESIQMPTGVVYADASANADVWVVTGGIAYALPESGITAARGNVAFCSNAESGRLEQGATAPVAEHWRECGHWLDTGSGNGALTRLMIHFN